MGWAFLTCTGIVGTRCHSLYDSRGDDVVVKDNDRRVMCGVAFNLQRVSYRSADHSFTQPMNRLSANGFRVAPSYP